jgi:hypothetical protein
MKQFIFTIFSVLFFVFISNSFAQTNWTKEPTNPVLSPEGIWEDFSVYAPSVIKQGDTLKMWYTGKKSNDVQQIGYATSTNGVSWQKYGGNPVLPVGQAGSWDAEYVGHPEIVFVDSLYHMWYGGSVDLTSFRIGYASSHDGINWTKYDDTLTTNLLYAQSDPVLPLGDSGDWDSATHAGWSIFFDGDSFNMWYGGCDNANYINGGFGYAKSVDGINWIKYAGNPIFSGSVGSWDSLRVTVPFVIVDGSDYKMWYQGNDGSPNWRIGYATSPDGITWSARDTCVLDIGNSGTWDDKAVSNPCVLLDQTTYKMWYAGEDYGTPNNGFHIGYATEPPDALEENDSNRYPNEFILIQNYPNPFNPKTNIEFSIPKSEFVMLQVYNMLGEEVASLVLEKLAAGNYKYNWDAGELSSGVYAYRIQVGEFQQIKKMILIK